MSTQSTQSAPVASATVLIDGVLVPQFLYDRVYALACTSGRTQFVGVIYDQPADLKPQPGESYDWGKIIHRDAMRRLHMATGEHLIFVVDKSRNELTRRHDIAVILWINP